MSQHDDDGAGLFWAVTILLLFGVFIVAGKLIQTLGTTSKPHRRHPAMVLAIVLWLLGLGLAVLVGTQDPSAGVVTGMVVTAIWAIAIASISSILRKRVEAARQDGFLPHYVDDDQWWGEE